MANVMRFVGFLVVLAVCYGAAYGIIVVWLGSTLLYPRVILTLAFLVACMIFDRYQERHNSTW